MADKAVITLQLGHYANFVGTHFWNLQEANFVFPSKDNANFEVPDINNDILFREGETLNNEVTFTPRLISVDLKGALGNLPQFGDLYETPTKVEDEPYWGGDVQVQNMESKDVNEFQKELQDGEANKDEIKIYDLENQVEVWSDFLATRYHIKTNTIIKEYQHKNHLKTFDVFGLGKTSWREEEAGEEIEDKVRHFVEEADYIQGFQILYDNFDAFGGLTSDLMELLKDEYGSKSTLVFPVSPATYEEFSPTVNATRFMNTILSLHSLIDTSSIITPMSLSPHPFVLPGKASRRFHQVRYEQDLNYHTSAILASALDTLSLPWRSRHLSDLSVHELTSGLTRNSRRVTSLALNLPYEIHENQYFLDTLDNAMNWTPITPSVTHFNPDLKTEVQAVCLRGLQPSKYRQSDFKLIEKNASNPYWRCDSIREALQHKLDKTQQHCTNGVFVSSVNCKVGKKPFPKIFSANLSSEGFITAPDKQANILEGVPMMTSWHNSELSSKYVQCLLESGRKVKFQKFHRFEEAGLEKDEFTEVIDDLNNLLDCYSESDVI